MADDESTFTPARAGPGKRKGTKQVRRWLAERCAHDARWSLVTAAAGILFALLVLYAAYWCIWMFIWFSVPMLRPDPMVHRLWSILGVAGLFVINRLVSRQNPAAGVEITINAGDRTTIVRPGNPRSFGTGIGEAVGGLSVRGLADQTSIAYTVLSFVLAGPRLLVFSLRLIQRATRLQAMHLDDCAAVLATLLWEDRRVPLDELYAANPSMDMQRVLLELRDLDGVMLIAKPPPGLSLSLETTEEFKDWKRRQKARKQTTEDEESAGA